MIKKLFILIFSYSPFLLCNSSAFGQSQHKIDSLKLINQAETETIKIAGNYNNIAGYYCDTNADSAFLYVNKALKMAGENGFKEIQAEAFYILSYLQDRTGEYSKAIENLEKAVELYTVLGDSSYLAGCYNNLGVLYSYGTNQKRSLEYFIMAMNLSEAINETFALSEAYSNIGMFYEYLKEYSSAIKYYTKALDIEKELDNTGSTGLSYLSIGRMNLKLQRFEHAVENLNNARMLIATVDDQYRQTELYEEFASYFLETDQLDSAQFYINLAFEKNKEFNYEKLDARILTLKGDLLIKQKLYNSALNYYNQAISLFEKQNTHDVLYDIYLSKASAYSGLGQHEKAFEMMQLAQKTNEVLNPTELAKTLGEFENEEATKEIKSKLNLEQELLIQKNKNELILMRAKLHGAIVSIAFLIILFGFVIYFYIEKRKHNLHLQENYKIIQEQKALLEENFLTLKNNEKKLSQLNATKDKFFSIIAHDLKNPFNVLIGLSDIVISDPDIRHSEDFEQIIDGIFQTAKSGYNLLDNLLEWARSQTGDLEYNPELLAMNKIIELNSSFFKEASKAKNIEICLLYKADFKILADYNMVNFIIRNLINNALKFSFPKSKIEINQQYKNGLYIFSVQDYGIGMNKETREKLFKIESTKPRKGTANEQGTGLGLIICKEFIEKNGGEIWVESKEGKGSCFYFSLTGEI